MISPNGEKQKIMEILIEVRRQHSPADAPYYQTIKYQAANDEENVATVLRNLNATPELRDTEGREVGEIHWQCSCLQKKCGACAMLINGLPRLACDTKLKDCRENRLLRLEPLKKFPIVRDLMVDRSSMMKNLRAIANWIEREAQLSEKVEELAYDASRCLQCGCCLEVCPNFEVGGKFYGAAAFVPASRVLSELPKARKYQLVKRYKKRVYSGCGKSLACHDICPVGIDVESKLVNSNAVAVWRRFFSSNKEENP